VAILQALFRLIARSASTALNAIFGWAVIALFGQTTPKEQTVYSALVAAAAAWPLLLIGVAFPKVALFVVAFVPLAKSVPGFWLRMVWIALAVLVPFVVGTAVAARGARQQPPEAAWKRLLRGFPITLALAIAFLLMLVIAPIIKIVGIVRRREIVRVPALMEKGATVEAARALVEKLESHGIHLRPSSAPWHLVAPSRILLSIGGPAFASIASDQVEHYRNPDHLAISVLPNETLLDGKADLVARAHAICTEVYAPRRVIQTFSAEARRLEARIERLWAIYRDSPGAHRDSRVLRSGLAEVAAELGERTLPWDEYQIVYRLLLQFDRALAGKPPLLDKAQDVRHPKERHSMAEERIALPAPGTMEKRQRFNGAMKVPVDRMTNRELIAHVVDNATLLARKEIELAKADMRKDLKAEIAMAKGLGVAGVCALCTLNLLLVACAMALGQVIAEWAAALIVAAVVLAVGTVAGMIGWNKRVTSPLETTRRSLKEGARWARERLA
jgi:hypothetical protein